MKFHYAGKYNGDENSLPQRVDPDGAVPFKEPQDIKKLALVLNIVALIITGLLLVILRLRCDTSTDNLYPGILGLVLALVCTVPHEFLHATLFREDVYMYQNLNQGMLFVTGIEVMSKTRFVLMSLFPNIVFGLLPFLIFLIIPKLFFMGMWGALSIGMGAGDYLNVFNALTQVPTGAKVYLSGMHSFWYQK